MLRIRTLGSLAVFADERPLAGAAQQPKRLALLALLARAGSRGVSRDRLLLLLWPEADEERGRRGLNQALYALRQEIGEAAISGSVELRLDPGSITSDVQEFEDARAAGRFEAAAALWKGPFLDGFGLPGLPEFERWAEGERDALRHEYAEVLETLATQAAARGDAVAAVGWWRRLASLDPHNARIAESLMRALAAAGDVPGALRHAEIFGAMLEAELGLPADARIEALAVELRSGRMERAEPADRRRGGEADGPAADVPSADPPSADLAHTTGWATVTAGPGASTTPVAAAASTASATPPSVPAPSRRPWLLGAALLAAAFLALAYFKGVRAPVQTPVEAPIPGATVIAIGRIADYSRHPTGERSAPLRDMLATNLARAEGVEVVSTARMYELLAQLQREGDSSDGAFSRAARLAGASQLVDGALYEVRPGRLRLDLRRVELAGGAVRAAHTVEGTDLFVLADSGTLQVVAGIGGRPASGSLASVTTSSEAAYRLYEAGLRAFTSGDRVGAAALFTAALREDSSFAMAQYYLSEATPDLAERLERMERAARLSTRASPREGLTIRAARGFLTDDASFLAVAETLAIRHPADVEAQYWYGQALLRNRQYAAGVTPLGRAIALDSAGLAGQAPRCIGCEAFLARHFAYVAMDSLPAAERSDRAWVARQPTEARPRSVLAEALLMQGKFAEARRALAEATARGLPDPERRLRAAAIEAYAANYAPIDTLLSPLLAQGDASARWDAAFDYALWLRAQGRFDDALRVLDGGATAFRGQPGERLALRGMLMQRGFIRLEQGRPREAAAVFDSAQRLVDPREGEVATTRSRLAALAGEARALAVLRDTAGLRRVADTMTAIVAAPGLERSRHLPSYPRALLAMARGDHAEVIALLTAMPHSSTVGPVGRDLLLAEAYAASGRRADAVAVLEAALRGYRGGGGIGATRTELVGRVEEVRGKR